MIVVVYYKSVFVANFFWAYFSSTMHSIAIDQPKKDVLALGQDSYDTLLYCL